MSLGCEPLKKWKYQFVSLGDFRYDRHTVKGPRDKLYVNLTSLRPKEGGVGPGKDSCNALGLSLCECDV
jgi:hypothetical protein